MEIVIDSPHVSRNEIRYRLHFPRTLRKYFLKDTSYVQYDSSLDIGNVDSSILAIPMASVVAPIAWAVGAEVRLDKLDETYLQSLDRIKELYRHIYPRLSYSGDIRAEKTVTNKFGGERTGVLFSGGVDSSASYLRHKDKKPDLIPICGVLDLPHFEEEFWSRVWADISSLANRDGIGAFQVKTDILRNINHELLTNEFKYSWYGVSSGLFLLGMVPPVTAVRGIKTVVVAASYTEDYEKNTGAHPSIDTNIAWADVNVLHDGYALSRQQKINYLCRRENIRYLSNLRVCWDSARKINCGNCEKCLRTITNLLLEGIDPNSCNFDIDAGTFPRLKDCFIKGRMKLTASQMFMWIDIKKNIPEQIDIDIYGSREFLTWLRSFDLSQYRTNRLRYFIWTARRLYSNKRIKPVAIRRKIKCYWYITLARLKLL